MENKNQENLQTTLNNNQKNTLTENELLLTIAKKIIKKNKQAFLELAK